MNVKKILSFAVVLAMVLTVVPTFGLVASAADEQVIYDLNSYDYTGEVLVDNYGLTSVGHVRLNEKNWQKGEWGDYGDGNGQSTLTFFKNTAKGAGNGVTEVATFNNAANSLDAGKIVIDFKFASRQTSDDNYMTWYFKDLDGNSFARIFWDTGTGKGNPIPDMPNATANFGIGTTQYIVNYGEATSRDQVLALRDVAFRIEAVKGDDGYTVTYYKDGQVLGTSEKVDNINGISNITADIGEYGTQWGGMGVYDLKITASDFATASTVNSVKKALDEIEVAAQSKGEKIELADSVNDGHTDFDVTWTSDNEEFVDSEGNVTVSDVVTVANLTPSTTFDGETVKGTSKKVVVFPASRAGKEYTTESAIYSIDGENQISNGSFEGDENINLTDWKSHINEDTNGAIYPLTTDITTIPDGKYAYGARWGDGVTDSAAKKGDKDCTIWTFFPVSAGLNYFSFYGKYLCNNYTGAKIYAYFSETDTHDSLKEPASTLDQLKTIELNTEWNRYEYIFDSEKDGYVVFVAYSLNEWANGNSNNPANAGACFDNFELYKAEQVTEELTKVEEVKPINIGNGTDISTLLPKTLKGTYSKGTVRDVDVTWNIQGLDFTNNAAEPKKITVTGTVTDGSVTLNPKVEVTVYYSFEISGENANGHGQYDTKKAITFPAVATDKLAVEYDVVFTKFGDACIQICDPTKVNDNFGNGCQVGLGVDAAGGFRPVNGNGTGGRPDGVTDITILTMKLGKTYHVTENIDVKTQKYSVSVYEPNGEYAANTEFGFRGNADQVGVMYLFDNQGEADFVVSNLKGVYGTIDDKMETWDVTVNYVTESGGNAVNTVKKRVIKGGDVSFDAYEYREGAKFYKAEPQTYTGVTANKTEEVVLENDDSKILSSADFSYNFSKNEVIWAGDNNFNSAEKTGTISIGWGNFRETIMAYKLPEITDKQMIKSAVLNTTAGFVSGTEGKGEYKVYAIDPSYVDVAGGTMKGLPGFDEVREDVKNDKGDVTEAKALQWSARHAVLNELKAVEVASITVKTNDTPAITLDLTKVKDFAVKDTLALLILSGNQVYTYSATTDKFPFLSDVETIDIPEIPTIEAKLSWNGTAFTIDYVPTTEVTPVEGATYAVEVSDGEKTLEGGAYVPSKDAGVGIVPNDTNRIYSATSTVTVSDVVFKAETAVKAGIYGLVMDAIVNSTLDGEINAEQLTVVNEVLKNGNILLTADEEGTLKLTEAADKVMTLEGDTITLTEKAVQLGLRFTTIGVGTDAATAPVATVSDDGKSITLPDGVTTAEAMVLSLDSVYLEFVPTEMADVDADGADAVQDFIPEL